MKTPKVNNWIILVREIWNPSQNLKQGLKQQSTVSVSAVNFIILIKMLRQPQGGLHKQIKLTSH